MQKFKGLLAQSCLTLCDPKNCSPPVSSVHGISPSRILEWEPLPSPGDLPNEGIKPRSPALQVGSLEAEPSGSPGGDERHQTCWLWLWLWSQLLVTQ